jgi:hypothetical protein
MATDGIERLHYFQRQYLGAEDFKAQQQYHRDMRRRHNIGHHTWGIVVGLALVEKPAESGNGVDVFIEPGMAVDGFGREIIVPEPTKLSPSDFEAFATLAHREVWIAYAEERAKPPASGYELCDVEDQSARVRETFRIVIEPSPPYHEDIVVGGKVLTPPPPVIPGDLTIPADESVPYQELTDEEPLPRWLVRLLEGRRYAGAVADELLAPAKKLVVRDRGTATPLPAADPGLSMTVEGALQVDRLLTAKDDVQIHGGKIDFRDAGGNGGGPLFTIQRDDAGGAGGKDLRIKIGNDSSGKNRLVIRSANNDKVTVADNGNTTIDGDLSVLNEKNLLIDGGRLNIQKKGSTPSEWALKVDNENLQFIEPDDGDRVVLELLDVSGDLDAPVLRLHGQANATLSSNQLVDLTDGGDTTLHTHPSATTLQKGMVEIASAGETAINGESGARLVIAANDTRLLTQLQKNELTGGGLTTLHRHPNGILNNVRTVSLFADNGTDIIEVNLFVQKRVVALISMRGLDPRASFDSGDGMFADILEIDGVNPFFLGTFSGGAHLGPPGSISNLFTSSFTGSAQRIRFRLRSTQDASVWATAVVFFEDL